MAGVDTIEIADGSDGGAEVGGDFGEGVEDFHSGDLKGELEAVVGEVDVGGEDSFGGVVVEVVADVGEVGAFGGEFFDVADGLLQVGVAGVGVVAEGVEDEDVEVLEKGDALGRDVGHVGEVSGIAEAVAGDLVAAVDDGDAEEAGAEEVTAKAYGCAGGGGDAVHGDAGAGGVTVLRAEGVIEDALDGVGGGVVGVEGEAVGDVEAEGAEVVEAEDMVGVAVGVEDGVDVGDALADGLGVEIRAGIDEDDVAVVGKADGGAGAAVVGLRDGQAGAGGDGRDADGAGTTERGDAHGGSGAEKGEVCVHACAGGLFTSERCWGGRGLRGWVGWHWLRRSGRGTG